MIHFTETVPIPLLIAAVFVLMIYPYIGAGILLAVLCFGAGHYALAAVCFAVCLSLHFVMQKHIKPVKGAVAPARSSRRRKSKGRDVRPSDNDADEAGTDGEKSQDMQRDKGTDLQ